MLLFVMTKKKLPELVIIFIKLMTVLLCSWPPSPQVTNIKILLTDLWFCLMVLIALATVLPLFYTMYLSSDNFMELTKAICFAASVIHGIIKMFICRRNRQEFQELIEDVQAYIKHAEPREQEALNDCIREAGPKYVIFNIGALMAGVFFVCGPIVLDQEFSFNTSYPFPIDYPLYQIIFTLQSIAVIQCALVSSVDTQVCMLIWYSTARLKLLAYDIKNVTSFYDLHDCIGVHQSILRFNERVTEIAKPICMTTVGMATISIAFGGIHAVGNEPFAAKVQFVGLDIGYGIELLVSAWAAERFMRAMDNVKWALYDSPWLKNSKKMNNSVMIVLQRLEKIPKISVGGFIPELSLNYYAVYMSKTMSFFTTLRVMLQRMEGIHPESPLDHE